MTILLNWRIWAALALAGMLAFTHLTAYRSGRHAVQAKWDAAKVAQERAAQEQTARNLDIQRQAEKKYVVTHDAQEKFFTTTVREIVHDAAPLAACVLPESVRLRINAAIECASADPAPTCGTFGEMPGPGEAAGSGGGQ